MKRLTSRIGILLASWITTSGFATGFEPLLREVSLMGTTMRITQYDPDRDRAIRHSEEWIRIVEDTEQRWSNWRESSEVSQLNLYPQNRSLKLSADLCDIIPLLQTYNIQTSGKFDPGIGQLLKIWGHYKKARVPSKKELAEALQATGIQKIQIDQKECTAKRTADVLLDAGAFGKGLALERILTHAQMNQSAPFLIDFGGQLLVYGKPDNAPPWEAELAHPEKRDQGAGIRIQFHRGSLSTSGGSERDRLINGKRIGHILDPHSGEPVLSAGSVSVWHVNPLAADILSTALYVLGPRKGLTWANENHIAACYLKVENGAVVALKSNSFSSLLN